MEIKKNDCIITRALDVDGHGDVAIHATNDGQGYSYIPNPEKGNILAHIPADPARDVPVVADWQPGDVMLVRVDRITVNGRPCYRYNEFSHWNVPVDSPSLIGRIPAPTPEPAKPKPAPVDLTAIRSGDWIAVEVVHIEDRGSVHVHAGGGVALMDQDAIRAHYPQPRPELEWGPVMVTEDGEPVVVGPYNQTAGWREVWRGDGATWIVDDDGRASDSDTGDHPRIVGPWTGE